MFYMPPPEDHRKPPNLHIQSACQEPLQCEGLRVTVISVSINLSSHECVFVFIQELEKLVRSVWEVNQK